MNLNISLELCNAVKYIQNCFHGDMPLTIKLFGMEKVSEYLMGNVSMCINMDVLGASALYPMHSSAFAKAATFKVPFHRTTATSYNRKLSRCRKLIMI